MPRNIVNFETVRNIGLTFRSVEESRAYGSPVLKVHGKILAGIAVNRSAAPGSLMLCLDLEDRAELLAADPDVYYVTDQTTTSITPYSFACLGSIPLCCGTCSAWPTSL